MSSPTGDVSAGGVRAESGVIRGPVPAPEPDHTLTVAVAVAVAVAE